MARKPRFYPKNKIDDPVSIHLIYRYAGWEQKQIMVSTRISVPQKYWDRKAQRVKRTKEFPLHTRINALIEKMEAQTVELIYDFRLMGGMPEPEVFKKALIAKIGIRQKPEEAKPTLFDFIRLFIEERQAMNRPQGSIQVYQNCLNNLEAYTKERRRKLDFGDISEAWKNDFLTYLFAQNFSNSYIHKILSTLKTIMRDAWKRGITEEDNFAKISLGISKKSGDKIYLTEAEIDVLARLQLEDNPRLDKVRDLFVIGCLTGQRYSDYDQIKPENIRPIEHEGKTVECWVFTQRKTGQKVFLPLVNPTLRRILEKHGNRGPKVPTNQKINEYLKDLAQLAGFTQKVEISEFKAGRQEKSIYDKWQLVSTHTARRSFATNAYKRGMPVADIMKFTGHTTVASFMQYLKLSHEETAVKQSEHDFFTGKKNGE